MGRSDRDLVRGVRRGTGGRAGIRVLADDAVCPEGERCILDAEVRFVEDGSGSSWEIRHATAGSLGRTSSTADATYQSAPCNIGDVLEVEIVGSDGRVTKDALALDMGWRYTVRIGDGRIVDVTRDGLRGVGGS